jgi:hypothetical protein
VLKRASSYPAGLAVRADGRPTTSPRARIRAATLVYGDLPLLVQLLATPMRNDVPDQPGVTGLVPNGPGDRVACKVMHAERRDAPGYRALVWDEAVLGLRVTAGHPNLVEILDFFDDAHEQLCIVILVTAGGGVNVTDFGIARVIETRVINVNTNCKDRHGIRRRPCH